MRKGGMPEIHRVDGKTFGAAVSAWAMEDPMELAKHVSGGRAGMEEGGY